MTEEDIFLENNPQFFYDHDTVNDLKKLYLELYDENERQIHENEWNLSVNALKEMILQIDDPDDSNKQNLLFKLNYLVEKISFPVYVPENSTLYTTCYDILCSAIDEICIDLNELKLNLNLPIELSEEAYPLIDESGFSKSCFNFYFKCCFKMIGNMKNGKKNLKHLNKLSVNFVFLWIIEFIFFF